MLHDVGKVVLNEAGEWEGHADLRGKFGGALDASPLLDLISQHHQSLDPNNLPPAEVVLLTMADGFHKSMHQTGDIEGHPAFRQLAQEPSFCPYFGQPVDRWDRHSATGLVARVGPMLGRKLNMKQLLEIQGVLARFPHTSYLPHLSLGMHNQFTALLFYFLCRQMDEVTSPLDLKELTFTLFVITPQWLPLFYRLKDLRDYEKEVGSLRSALHGRVFKDDVAFLPPGFAPGFSPFEFFQGNSLVVVYDDADKIKGALQDIVNDSDVLRSLEVEATKYRLESTWETDKDDKLSFWGDCTHTSSQTWSVLSEESLRFPTLSLERCSICGKPSEDLVLDEGRGDMLCPICQERRRRERPADKVVDLQRVSQGPRGPQRVGYLFVALREPLRDEAVRVAEERLFPAFMKQRMVSPRILGPTEVGLFEYLQAVRDIGALQGSLAEQIEAMRKGDDREAARVLVELTTLSAYVLREDRFWPFLDFVNQQRKKLQLDSAVRTVLCHPKQPFWSLMDRFTTYEKGDLYYDVSEGSIVMFTDAEVSKIRDIAGIAEREWRSGAQLSALSRFARSHTLEELLLEIDVRARHNKLASRLPRPLREGLQGLSYEPDDDATKRRMKRAKFIDYIAKMSKRMPRGKKGRR